MASTLAGLLSVPAVLAGTVALLSPAVANAGVTSASCRIYAIEATKEGDGKIPAELEFLADQLKAPAFATYQGFRLQQSLDYKLEVGRDVDKKFKSGHNVKLQLLGGEKDKLELRTELLRGGTSMLQLDFSIKVAQVLLIPVPRGDQATIFAYQCKG